MERNDLFVAAMVRRIRYSYPRVVNQDVGREVSSWSFLSSYFYLLPICSRERHGIRQRDDNENETSNLFSRTGNLRKYSTSNVIRYGCSLIHALKSIKSERRGALAIYRFGIRLQILYTNASNGVKQIIVKHRTVTLQDTYLHHLSLVVSEILEICITHLFSNSSYNNYALKQSLLIVKNYAISYDDCFSTKISPWYRNNKSIE